jgi:hypothetical protein
VIDVASEKLVPVKKLSQQLDVHRRTIERWFEQGLDSIRIGRKVFTTRAALDRFARQQGSGPARKKRGRPKKKTSTAAPAAPTTLQKRKAAKRQPKPSAAEQQSRATQPTIAEPEFID